MEIVNALVPSYYKNFKCIGSDCEYTCCRAWDISIDKNTYEMYKKIEESNKHKKNKKFSPLESNCIKRNKGNKNTNEYASFLLQEEKQQCPFLDENMLCKIYINLGEKYIPHTCKVYPRSINYIFDGVNKKYEASLSSSCPYVIDIALKNKEPMEFEYIETDIINKNLIRSKLNYNKEYKKYFWDIRIASIKILQDRKYTIVNRLVLLSMMYSKLSQAIESENYQDILPTIGKYLNIADESDNSIFENLSMDYQKQLAMYIAMYYYVGKNERYDFARFISNCQKIFDDFDLPESNIYDKKKVLNSIEEKYSYMFENNLVNTFFNKLLPFGINDNLLDSLIYLCSQYTMIKILLLGHIYSVSEDVSEDDIKKIIYMLSRTTMHNESYVEVAIENCKNWRLDTPAGIYTLIA